MENVSIFSILGFYDNLGSLFIWDEAILGILELSCSITSITNGAICYFDLEDIEEEDLTIKEFFEKIGYAQDCDADRKVIKIFNTREEIKNHFLENCVK